MSEKERMVRCDVCGGENARVRLVSRTYGHGENLFVIENVPVVSCPDCGQSCMTAETLHEIERLKLHRHTLSEQKEVEVVKFGSPEPSQAA